mmetsp:Transcript_10196/g.25576  ORF Transcript_10196/g.25576 Transcript_10196/m.25576 type:complete len:87 (-) Transcript_10196:13-273(-)
MCARETSLGNICPLDPFVNERSASSLPRVVSTRNNDTKPRIAETPRPISCDGRPIQLRYRKMAVGSDRHTGNMKILTIANSFFSRD